MTLSSHNVQFPFLELAMTRTFHYWNLSCPKLAMTRTCHHLNLSWLEISINLYYMKLSSWRTIWIWLFLKGQEPLMFFELVMTGLLSWADLAINWNLPCLDLDMNGSWSSKNRKPWICICFPIKWKVPLYISHMSVSISSLDVLRDLSTQSNCGSIWLYIWCM